MYVYINTIVIIYIYIPSTYRGCQARYARVPCTTWEDPAGAFLHPVSITRFPLRRFSPGAGLLTYVFFIGSG